MPYITEERRDEINGGRRPFTPGELNYCVTKMLLSYWSIEPSYQNINDILGALEGAKLEFYRRVVVPYEDKKIEENGDVYGV